MSNLIFILGDQLSHNISSLQGISDNDIIFMCEVMEEATYVSHHLQKLVFVFASMRNFASELTAKNYNVHYVKLTNPNNSGSFTKELLRFLAKHQISKIIITEASEYRVQKEINTWPNIIKHPVEVREDTRFLCSKIEFNDWAKAKKQLRMEFFYREMRKKYNILMTKTGTPQGGEWNYDKYNRLPPTENMTFTARPKIRNNQHLKDVITMVQKLFKNNFGSIENYNYATTAHEANKILHNFIENILPNFGSYQDAMLIDQPFLNHSLISAYLNIGFLEPLKVCQLAEIAYKNGTVSLHSAEGFIRQILGWREFIRGIYWLKMPTYQKSNFLHANKPLPEFYWNSNTQMACIAEVVKQTSKYAYSHHIQRLMVTGNFALLAGIDVKAVHEWYLAVYIDAFEWVEMPNTIGMALHADGGVVGSKPYAASGKYINKMSNFCEKCSYNPNKTIEDTACPFNALYWDFHARNEAQLSKNPRLTYVYATWKKFSSEKQKMILEKAKQIFSKLKSSTL